MARSTREFNYDRIHSAQALIAITQNDMMRCLHNGDVVDVVKDRMIESLELAIGNLSKLKLSHD